MNYPSTTQALFALIVMIIVLLFILVYCCWGTFSCARQDDSSNSPEDGAAVVREIQGPGGRSTRMVIVPFSNMIYVGDPESRRIYEIPVEQDKPPAYTEVFDGVPPPPYSTDNQDREAPINSNSNNESNTQPSLPDLPPSYEDCLTSKNTDAKWPEVLEAIMLEQAKHELAESGQQQSGETLVTQLPPMHLPSLLTPENELLLNQRTQNHFLNSLPTPLESNTGHDAHSDESSISTETNRIDDNEPNSSSSQVTDLLDPWTPSHLEVQQLQTLSQNPISEDSNSSTTDEEIILSSSVSSVSESTNVNDGQEESISQLHSENLHSMQDNSKV